MSEPIICEFCGSKSKSKYLLTTHQKNTAKCIKKQVEKLGKPLHSEKKESKKESKKNVKKQPKKEDKEEEIEEDKEEENEEDEEIIISSEESSENEENEEIPFSSDEESEISEDEESKEINFKESDNEEEVVRSKFSNAKLFKNTLKKEEPPRLNNPLPLNQRTAPVNKLQELINQRMNIANKIQRQDPPPKPASPKPASPKPESPKPASPKPVKEIEIPKPKQEITKPQVIPPSINNKEIEAKLSLILNALSSKDNKTVEEIKKLKEEMKTRDEETKQQNDIKNKENRVIEEIRKLREELKARDEEAKTRNETVIKSIGKLEKVIDECNPSAMVEIIKKIQAEVESKEELLQIFKEDLEETCDKYYELYKKLKDVKYDMEEMVYNKKK